MNVIKAMFLSVFLGISMGISANTQKQMVIFDLGGVLLAEAEVNLHKAESSTLKVILRDTRPKIRIFNRAFKFATLFHGSDSIQQWILGNLSGSDIVNSIKANIDKAEYDSFFTDEYERSLIKYGVEFILIPDLLAELTEIVHEGFEFVKRCKDNGIDIAIISNWDPASFEIMKVKMPELFGLFDEKNIVIPEMIGKTKPSREIYDYTIKRIGIDPSCCFFIDDSKANVEGAERYGIKSVHHTNWKDTERELLNRGLSLGQ